MAELGTVRACIEIYKEELSNVGRKFEGFTIMRDVYLSRNRDAALEESKKAFLHMYQEDYSRSGHPLVGNLQKNFEEWAANRFIIGDENDTIDAIESYRKLGADYIILRTSLRGLRNEQITNTIRILGEGTLPHFMTQ